MYLDQLVIKANASIVEYEEPMKYLTVDRGITVEDINRFQLGFTSVINVPNDGSSDYERLKKETYDWGALKKKILFPLQNSVGRTNGMIARPVVVEEGKSKYKQVLTSEAKTIGTFFGLHQAIPEILRTGVVYVVEGAIDCISLAKVFPNTVSVLTAYINEDQYWVLKMLAKRICVVFDSDEAGKKGMEMIDLKYKDKSITRLDLGYNDPNSCLNTLGPRKFESYAKRKLSVLSF